MNNLSTQAPAFCLVLALAACGGGGSGTPAPAAGTSPADVPAAAATTTPAVVDNPVDVSSAVADTADAADPTEPAVAEPNPPATASSPGTSCAVAGNTDVLGGLRFQTSHRINANDYGCLIVRKDQGHPVFDGAESARFEVRPADCSASASFDDCKQDRSRHEINETTLEPTSGSTLVYTTRLFIPEQERFKPRGRNTLFLTQINFVDGAGLYGTLAYLEVADNGDLLVRTDKDFTFGIKAQYPVYQKPFGKWIKVMWEIRSTPAADGYLRVYVDDVLRVNESRATLPSATATNRLKIGIYNVFKSRASEPYANQVVYFDGIARTATPSR